MAIHSVTQQMNAKRSTALWALTVTAKWTADPKSQTESLLTVTPEVSYLQLENQ